jgi:hypothetical protein
MPNKPLEWTGRRRVCLDSNSFLPATQGQRSKDCGYALGDLRLIYGLW